MNQEGFEAGKKQLKYHTKNPIYNYLVNGFNSTVKSYFENVKDIEKPKRILEIGVGEGQITELCLSVFPDATFIAADIAKGILDVAQENLSAYSDRVSFEVQDITKLTFDDNSFDMVICCEVLEHVPGPRVGMAELSRVLKPGGHAVLSVPNEPLWRVLNMARGYYWKDFGNTPGHVNHWSTSAFRKDIVDHNFMVIKTARPLPWSMFLCRMDQ